MNGTPEASPGSRESSVASSPEIGDVDVAEVEESPGTGRRRYAACDEVEIHGLQHEPHYNGCRGWVLQRRGEDALVRLNSNGSIGGIPWTGTLGGRGNRIPRHARTLPWEAQDTLITRMKDATNKEGSISPASALAIPGSLEMERVFHVSVLRVVRKGGGGGGGGGGSAPRTPPSSHSPQPRQKGYEREGSEPVGPEKKPWYVRVYVCVFLPRCGASKRGA